MEMGPESSTEVGPAAAVRPGHAGVPGTGSSRSIRSCARRRRAGPRVRSVAELRHDSVLLVGRTRSMVRKGLGFLGDRLVPRRRPGARPSPRRTSRRWTRRRTAPPPAPRGRSPGAPSNVEVGAHVERPVVEPVGSRSPVVPGIRAEHVPGGRRGGRLVRARARSARAEHVLRRARPARVGSAGTGATGDGAGGSSSAPAGTRPPRARGRARGCPPLPGTHRPAPRRRPPRAAASHWDGLVEDVVRADLARGRLLGPVFSGSGVGTLLRPVDVLDGGEELVEVLEEVLELPALRPSSPQPLWDQTSRSSLSL